MAESRNRFVKFGDDELKDFLKAKTSKRTDSATKTAVTLLKTFCADTEEIVDFEQMSATQLDKLLQKFYAGVRKANGDLYKFTTMNGFRFGLQRFFLEATGMDIIGDTAFDSSNACFKNVLALIKKAGKGEITHYPEIEPEDIKKLYSSFDLNTPSGLQDKVWFDIMFYLCRRGRENLRDMNKSTFYVSRDATGKQFLYQCTSEIDKNHGVYDTPFDTNGEGRIYETNGPNCPVKSFIKYLGHLHPIQPAFWQRPRENIQPTDSIWYCSSPLGEKSLGGMMPKLSQKYKLSERYTNHSIRVTSLQVLDDEHYEGRHIVRISGHKSVDSVKNYARRLSASRKRNISASFATHLASPQTEASKRLKSDIKPNHTIVNDAFAVTVSPKKCTNKTSSVAVSSSSESLVDFSVVDSIDDNTLQNIPAGLLRSFNSFSNCTNCQFTFHVHMHSK